jgi:hypothetical protein
MTRLPAFRWLAALASVLAMACGVFSMAHANVIDGADDRGSILTLGATLGLSPAEIQRIRSVSGHVACVNPMLTIGSGALFLTSGQILTAAHILYDGDQRELRCSFRLQTPGANWIELKLDPTDMRMGSAHPKPGSNDDWAVIRLSQPIAGARPFAPDAEKPIAGDPLIVVSAHPVGLDAVPLDVPVVQGCKVRRVPVSSAATSFYRTDCDASAGSSGAMQLHRGSDGALVFRGITISTGPSTAALAGAPYNERSGSVTTALGTDAAILAAGRELAGQ